MPSSLANRARLAVSRSRAYRRGRDLVLRSGRDTYWVVREDLARRYLCGQGIEIGALAAPLRLPPGVDVRYVDHADRDELLASEGPSLAASGVDPERIVRVDIVDDAERLSDIADDSVDFVFAAHVIEHLENPVAAMANMLRVTRPGGVVMMVLPDPRFTVDRPRDPPRHSFHVWELPGFLELLHTIRAPFEIVHAQSYGIEFAVVLRSIATDAGLTDTPSANPPFRERAGEADVLPPTVAVDHSETVLEYTRARLRQHTQDTYAGVPLSKFPEDLRVYEHLLWLADPDVVIELGVQFGASSLWFRDRLNALSRYRPGRRRHVIAIDSDLRPALGSLAHADRSPASQITLIEGSVTDASLPDRVAALIEPGARCLVVEDTAHIYATTAAALSGFARFVPPGGFFIVEDGCVDVEALRIDERWPRGVLPALRDWLETEEGHEFTVRADLQLYGVTCHPGGFLQRRADR